jgi:peptidyl-dipeptidase Dcp
VFRRIDAVFQARHGLGLTPEQLRLVERTHRDFTREGAQLPVAARAEFAAIQAQLAELNTRFAQNLLHDENAFTLPLADEAAMDGLPEFVRAAARQAAAERGLAQPVITLGRSLILSFLGFSRRRDLRELVWRAWVSRGAHPGAQDNRPVAQQILDELNGRLARGEVKTSALAYLNRLIARAREGSFEASAELKKLRVPRPRRGAENPEPEILRPPAPVYPDVAQNPLCQRVMSIKASVEQRRNSK